ncbi:MAG: LPS-assembly protein LptD [Chitinophagaceae bacterium]|nr:LPS-assembly protein LptD [Chitinophagaceae bacterium]
MLPIVACGYLLILTFLKQAYATEPIPANYWQEIKDTVPEKQKLDTIRTKSDSLIQKQRPDSVSKTDTIKISKDSIDAPIKYAAADSGVLIIDTKEFLLYGKAKTEYKDLQMEAATIRYDQQSQMVKAYGSLDSTGNPMSKPQFTQGEMKSVSDSIFYDMRTAKGLTKNTFFQEGEIYVNAQKLKKVSATEVFASKARFTTCNLDTPHFAFRTSRMKIVNNKLGISSAAFPEFEGVPMPIGIPFGIFPLSKQPQSGLMAPAFTASEDFGLGLEGLGYYFLISDYVDLTTRTNIYSYGGWMANFNSKYIQR